MEKRGFVHGKRVRRRTMARTFALVVLTVATISAVGSAAVEPGFLVIVHRDNTESSIPRARLDAIFLGKITVWPDGLEIMLVNHEDTDLRDQFSNSIHARPEAAVNAYWAAKSFKDAVVPPARLGDDEIVAFVAEHPGAIGYVSPGTPLHGVKRLAVVD